MCITIEGIAETLGKYVKDVRYAVLPESPDKYLLRGRFTVIFDEPLRGGKSNWCWQTIPFDHQERDPEHNTKDRDILRDRAVRARAESMHRELADAAAIGVINPPVSVC